MPLWFVRKIFVRCDNANCVASIETRADFTLMHALDAIRHQRWFVSGRRPHQKFYCPSCAENWPRLPTLKGETNAEVQA